MAYNRKTIQQIIGNIWEQAKETIHRLFVAIDLELQKIQAELDRVTPATTTDNAIARYDGVTGALQNSGVTIPDTNVITSAVTTGTAPLVIASTTVVSNLNVDMVDSKHITETVDTALEDTDGSFKIGSMLMQWGIKASSASADVEITLGTAYDDTAEIFSWGEFNDTAPYNGDINIIKKPGGYDSACLLWNKLEADAGGGVVTSIIGPNGAITGNVVFAPAKFGNGARATSNTDGAIEYGNIGLQNSGCIEGWVKAGYNSGAGQGEWLWNLYLDNNNRILLTFDSLDSRIGYYIIYAGNVLYISHTKTWSINELIHIAFVWDKNAGFDGAKTSAIYIDNVQVVSDTTVFNFGSTFPKFCNLAYYSSDALQPYNRCIASLFDNIKVWNYAKIDFSDRNTEAVSSASYPNKLILGAWNNANERVAKSVKFYSIGKKS